MIQARTQDQYVIGLDAGGTHTRVGCFGLDGTRLADAVGGGGAPHHNDDARENVRGAIAAALERGDLDPAKATGLAAGIAGFPRSGSNQDGGDRGYITGMVDLEELSCTKVVVNDAVIAHRGALSGRAGIVVVAGTGSMILGIDEQGTETESGQLGHYAGAARHLVHDVVQRILVGDAAPTDPLLPATLEHFGAADIPALRAAVLARSAADRNDAKRLYGDLAPQVTALAEDSELAGDALDDLVARTARGVRLLAPVVGGTTIPVACTGSLASAPSFRGRLEQLLECSEPRRFEPVTPRLDPLGGAALLALEAAGVAPDDRAIDRVAGRQSFPAGTAR
ncbi:BadF/BadG/BcrA/BcrD ATPase family protein [Brachybacterium sp. YJGR34]|uniref:BadF/BadG/BcrA/BcrD ATPase family protein n=1 Tax=Brachybacterium sp. YJGR34 TaxID=2059911 RepID=UPI000E0A5D9B|nr:BadF/BadG/BcrA/BcrD ATPase family protein [Brachybacterium sp. YJGR34]